MRETWLVPDPRRPARHRLFAAHHQWGRRRFAAAFATTVAVVLVSALVVLGTANGQKAGFGPPAAASPPVTLPQVVAPVGWAPLDYGLLRIYLPPGWGAVGRCAAVGTYLIRPNAAQPLSCEPARSGWASVQPLSSPPAKAWKLSDLNRTAVWAPRREPPGHETLDIPSLHVELAAVGTGRKVLRTAGPSALGAVLVQHAAVPVPSSWKAVRFDGLQADVPAAWPVDIVTRDQPVPGACGAPVFRTPIVYLGDNGSNPICGLFVAQLAPPVDGLWITSGTAGQADPNSRALHFGALPATLRYSYTENDAEVTVQYGPKDIVVGLGAGPATAEEIISSVRPNNLPASASTPTTPPGPNTPTTKACRAPGGCKLVSPPATRTSFPSSSSSTVSSPPG